MKILLAATIVLLGFAFWTQGWTGLAVICALVALLVLWKG